MTDTEADSQYAGRPPGRPTYQSPIVLRAELIFTCAELETLLAERDPARTAIKECRLSLFSAGRAGFGCPECGGQMKVVSFLEPPQADVIEEILKHCGLWQPRSPRGPPHVGQLVLELDAAYSGSSIDSPEEADQSQEPTYVDIDTFLASF